MIFPVHLSPIRTGTATGAHPANMPGSSDSLTVAKVPATIVAGAAHALLDGLAWPGLARAGVGRLLLIGIGTTLETAPGVLVHDAPGFPEEGRAFSRGHAAELGVLRTTGTEIDWLVLAPPPAVLDGEAPRTGRYRTGGKQVLPAGEDAAPFSYTGLAVALIDEIEAPNHRTLTAIAP